MQSDPLIEHTHNGKTLRFHTTWGLFSPKAIDAGSEILLKNLKLEGTEDILDLGCGYGPLGLSLATQTSGKVLLVDNNFVAVEYTQKNIEENKLTNAKAQLSHAFRDIPKTEKFDLIVSNIPAKVGKELLTQILLDAKAQLKPKGRLVVVTIAGLRQFMKRNLTDVFGNYRKIKQDKGYCLAESQKN